MITAQELNREFGSDRIHFHTAPHGLISAELDSPGGKGVVALHGAQVLNFIPKGQEAVLWNSEKSWFEPGKPIRGGIPVCWPWFGSHPDDSALPSHGFARLSEWKPAAAGECRSGAVFLELKLTPQMIADKFKNADFLLKLRVEVSSKLSAALIIGNTGKNDLSYSAALHSYFNISDISRIAISGLDDSTFIDTLDNTIHRQQGKIRFTAETDRLYEDTAATCVIDDPGFRRRVIVAKNGSRSTVIWNPWEAKSRRMPDFGDTEFHNMVCVETANAGTDTRTLTPGESHTLQVIIEAQNY
ncbi:MAG: D-hexose-6-phosphate mutarotase [Victivallaceae bacterium]|nr:D-hexose-6-phosphate mutarotase [Victivallaceae bacterium]